MRKNKNSDLLDPKSLYYYKEEYIIREKFGFNEIYSSEQEVYAKYIKKYNNIMRRLSKQIVRMPILNFNKSDTGHLLLNPDKLMNVRPQKIIYYDEYVYTSDMLKDAIYDNEDISELLHPRD